jgi:hypothetical protein
MHQIISSALTFSRNRLSAFNTFISGGVTTPFLGTNTVLNNPPMMGESVLKRAHPKPRSFCSPQWPELNHLAKTLLYEHLLARCLHWNY